MGLQCYPSYPQDSQEEYPVNVWFPPSKHYEAHIDNDSKVDAGIIGGHDIRQRLGHAQDVGKEVLHPEIWSGCHVSIWKIKKLHHAILPSGYD